MRKKKAKYASTKATTMSACTYHILLSAEQRRLFFWCACIPMRLFVLMCVNVVECHASVTFKSLVGLLFLLPCIWWSVCASQSFESAPHFPYIGLRSGGEVGFFGGCVWWRRTRIVHTLAYFAVAFHLFMQPTRVCNGTFLQALLMGDVIVGTLMWFSHTLRDLV